MSTENIYEKIDNYLNGTLSEVERAAFEAQLQQDASLREKVQLVREVDSVLSEEDDLNFQRIVESETDLFLKNLDSNSEGELKEEKKSPPPATPTRKIGGFSRRWAIAASFLLLLVSIMLLWQLQSNHPLSNEELFAQYSDTYPLNEDLRGSDSTISDFEKGIQQYQANNFDAATEIFEILLAKNEQDMSLSFCLANAYFNQNPPQFDLASKQFQKIITNDSSIYVPKAKWYLALIWLQKEELEKAKKLLKEVEVSGDKFGKKAKDLLIEIEQ